MKTTLKIFNEFRNMARMPIIEVNLKDYNLADEDDWIYFTLQADEHGLYTMVHNTLIVVPWDENCTLDMHIESIYYDIMSELSL